MLSFLHDPRTAAEPTQKAAWLDLMDDTGDAVEAVRSAFTARGRAEVWRRDDAVFAEAFDARCRDVDSRILNSMRHLAQAGHARAAVLCMRVASGLNGHTVDEAATDALPSDVTAAMLDAGLAAMLAIGDASLPSHA